tara:strand:+ start:13891 stop:14067 length:177 start_codon:yes stop_codon:yes gene_type:complete
MKMRRYGVTIQFTGSAYVEVDVPNGEDPEDYAMDAIHHKDVSEWEMEPISVEEVDPNE